MSDQVPVRLRTHPVQSDADLDLPRTLFDERWKDPRLAARVAFEVYKLGGFAAEHEATARLLLAPEIPTYPSGRTDRRHFALSLVETLTPSSVGFRGGSFNEMQRRYAYGGAHPTSNFHAKVVCFGLDSDGRFFLRAMVGRWGGLPGSEAALIARFLAHDEVVGAASWEGDLEGKADLLVLVRGRSPLLRERFAAIDAAEVEFYAQPTTGQPAKR